MKRSHEPVFWLLFGAGGTLAALLGFALIVTTGILAPAGLLPAKAMSFAQVYGFATTWFGKLFILAVISLFIWHGVHRMAATLHHLGLAGLGKAQFILRGIALAATLTSAHLLFYLGA